MSVGPGPVRVREPALSVEGSSWPTSLGAVLLTTLSLTPVSAGSLGLPEALLRVEPLYPSASLFPLVTLPPTAASGLVAASVGTLTLAPA